MKWTLMERSDGICTLVRKAATHKELQHPHGVNKFLLLARQGTGDAQAFAQKLGQTLYEEADDRNTFIGVVFAEVSVTMPKTEIVSTLTQKCVATKLEHCALLAARSVASANDWVRREVEAVVTREVQERVHKVPKKTP